MAMGRVFSGTRPAPNGTGFNFNKRVWEFFFKTRDGFGAGSSIALSCPAPPCL